MTDENQKKLKEINEKLKEIMLRHMEKPDVCASAINGLTLVRRETVNSSERCFEKSLASVISRAASPPSWAHRNFIYTRTNVVFPGWTCRARPMLSAPRRPPLPFPVLLPGQADSERSGHGNGTGGKAKAYPSPMRNRSSWKPCCGSLNFRASRTRSPSVRRSSCANFIICFSLIRREELCKDCTRAVRETTRMNARPARRCPQAMRA